MGVVNVTADSFYPESRFPTTAEAVRAGQSLLEAGADILDIGGESSRPGSVELSAAEETRRVVPVIEKLRGMTAAFLSVDTRKADVAARALSAGADIVNDISALRHDPRMGDVVAEAAAGVILMHMQGTPETMQAHPHYDDVVSEVIQFLAEAAERARAGGIASDAVALDPGIGFGKTVEHNLELLGGLPRLVSLGKPLVVGTSRKTFLGRLLTAPPEGRLFGTAASVAASILGGAHIVRVHDVREMRDVVRVTDAIRAHTSPVSNNLESVSP